MLAVWAALDLNIPTAFPLCPPSGVCGGPVSAMLWLGDPGGGGGGGSGPLASPGQPTTNPPTHIRKFLRKTNLLKEAGISSLILGTHVLPSETPHPRG